MTATLVEKTEPIRWQVSYKKNWGDDWTIDEWLMPTSVKWSLAPVIPTATVIRDFGHVTKLGTRDTATTVTNVEALDLRGYYIKIYLTFETYSRTWIGYCPAPADRIDGSHDVGTVSVDKGRTTYNIFGLEWKLKDTVILQSSKFQDTVQIIPWSPSFNQIDSARYRRIVGNRTNGPTEGVFHLSETDNEPWGGLDVLEHLVYHWSKQTGQNLDWEIGGDASLDLDNVLDVWSFDGQNYYQAISAIANPSRGFVFHVDVNPSSGNPRINILAATENDILDEDGGVIVTGQGFSSVFDLANDTRIMESTIKHLETGTYDNVEVRGAPLRVVFTVAGDPDHADFVGMDEDWTAEELAEYNAEESDAGYAKEELESVFTRFKIPVTWDGLQGASVVLPKIDTFIGNVADPVEKATFYFRNKLLDRVLPVPELDNGKQLRRPFAVYADPNGTYRRLDKPADEDFTGLGIGVTDDSLGVKLRTGSRPNHIVADGTFSGTGSEVDAQWDYRNLLVTVSMQTDEIARVILPTVGGESGQDTRTLVIDMPWCEVWYVIAGTLKTLDPSKDGAAALVTYAADEYARDDSDKLMRAAYLARAWYGVPRNLLNVTYGAPFIPVDDEGVGRIISEVNTGQTSAPINTIISEVTYKLGEKTQELTYKTSFPKFDIARMVGPVRGGAGRRRRSGVTMPGGNDIQNIDVRSGSEGATQALKNVLNVQTASNSITFFTGPGGANSTAPVYVGPTIKAFDTVNGGGGSILNATDGVTFSFPSSASVVKVGWMIENGTHLLYWARVSGDIEGNTQGQNNKRRDDINLVNVWFGATVNPDGTYDLHPVTGQGLVDTTKTTNVRDVKTPMMIGAGLQLPYLTYSGSGGGKYNVQLQGVWIEGGDRYDFTFPIPVDDHIVFYRNLQGSLVGSTETEALASPLYNYGLTRVGYAKIDWAAGDGVERLEYYGPQSIGNSPADGLTTGVGTQDILDANGNTFRVKNGSIVTVT